MANTYTFDGSNTTINVDTTGSFTVLDCYSRWKDWLLMGDNVKYFQAFNYVGGEPTVGSDSLGITYFLINGWRIKPTSVDHRLQVEGNLFTSDGSSPFLPASGSFSVIVEHKVSNLTDATVLDNPISEGLDYGGYVYIDASLGSSGTTYPIGTSAAPVNNVADAKIIALKYGIRQFYILFDLTVSSTDNIDGYRLQGLSGNITLTFESGSSASNSLIENVNITGYLSNDTVQIRNSVIYDLTEFTGVVTETGLSSSIHPGAGSTVFDKCYSIVPGLDSPIIDLYNEPTTRLVSFRSYSGGLLFQNNVDPAFIATVEYIAGRITIDTSFTTGFISIRGVATISGSNGVTLETGSLIQPTQLGTILSDTNTIGYDNKNLNLSQSLQISNIETNVDTIVSGSVITDDQIREIWELHGLDINKPITVSQSKRLFGAIDQDIVTVGTGSLQTTTITRN